MITQTYKIDLVPHGEPVVVHVSQYDTEGRTLVFELYNGGVAYEVPDGATASISGTKPDGTGFAYALTVNGNATSVDIPQQMALVAGDVTAEIRLSSGTAIIGSANFIIRVERAALDEDTAISETDVPIFEELVQQAQSAATTAGTKAAEAETSATAADTAKTAAQAAQTATEALFPTGGTAGQYLEKTATGTAWADIDALPTGGTAGQVLTKTSSADGDAGWSTISGGNLMITVTYENSTYTADHTFAEIEANIAAGGEPIVFYSNGVYQLMSYTAGTSALFAMANNAGAWYSFRINSSGVTRGYNPAFLETTVTLAAADWSGNVQTISYSSIAADSLVMLAMPDASTEADLETQIAAFETADLYAFYQRAGAIDVYARGTVPTADMTVKVIVIKRY